MSKEKTMTIKFLSENLLLFSHRIILLMFLPIILLFQTSCVNQKIPIALVVHSDVKDAISEELDVFRDDLNIDDYDVLDITVYDTTQPAVLRQQLLTLWLNEGLQGAILVGAVPAPLFEKQALSGPIVEPVDYYYMELNGSWQDNDTNGAFDYLGNGTGDWGPEIWVGRIDASTLSKPPTLPLAEWQQEGEAYYLKKYFTKNHKFRIDEYESNGKALYYNAIYTSGPTNYPSPAEAYTVSKVDSISAWDEDSVSIDTYKSFSGMSYDWLFTQSHSTAITHSFPQFYPGTDEILASTELRNIPQALFVTLNACSAVNFLAEDYLGGFYIFDDAAGLAVIGYTGVSTPIGQTALFRSLSGWGLKENADGSTVPGYFEYFPPRTIGEAYFHMLRRVLYNTGNSGDLPQSVIDDLFPALLGDPTLRPPGVTKVTQPIVSQGPALKMSGDWVPYPQKGNVEIKPVDSYARLDKLTPTAPTELVVWLTNTGDEQVLIDSFEYLVSGVNPVVEELLVIPGAVSMSPPFGASGPPYINAGESDAYVIKEYHQMDKTKDVTVSLKLAYHGKAIATPKAFPDPLNATELAFGTATPFGYLTHDDVRFSVYTGNLLFSLRNDSTTALNVPGGEVKVVLEAYLNDVNKTPLGNLTEMVTVAGGVVFSQAKIGKHVLCDNTKSVPHSTFTDMGAQSGDELIIKMIIDPDNAIEQSNVSAGSKEKEYYLVLP